MVFGQFFAIMFADASHITNVDEALVVTLKSQTISLVSWLPMLLLIATARRENGFRGVHELLTGTRVVRLAGDLESKLLDQLPVVAPCATEEKQLGEYEILGCFSRRDERANYLGRDRKLDRPVWLFGGFAENPINEARRHLNRGIRLRIIRQETENGHSWFATESLPGCSILDAIDDERCNWSSFCPLLRDVAYELALSAEQGLVPQQITPDHLWVDHTGRIRVLDHALVDRFSARSGAEVGGAIAANRAFETVQFSLQRFLDRHPHPVEALDIRDGLNMRGPGWETFAWLGARLTEAIERPSSWNMVDRVGLLAVAMCLELPIIVSSVFISGFALIWLKSNAVNPAAMAGIVGCLLAAILGWIGPGGPALQLNGTSLRRHRDKKQASCFRGSIRGLLTWSPWIAAATIGLAAIQEKLLNNPTVLQVNFNNSAVLNQSLPWLLLIGFLILAGLAVAVINPHRGLPDYLTGTRLMRK
jgi:hypothetical protein